MRAFQSPHFDHELHSESNSETLTTPATKLSKSALNVNTQLLSTFRVQLSSWEPEVPTQKQNILQAKIHTGFMKSSDKQLLRAFENITPMKDYY